MTSIRLNLSQNVWEEIENIARSAGASFELSERLKRIVCEYWPNSQSTR